MDAAARKSFEIQTQVRHNAETYQSTLKDLQNWEREIKEKENNLQKELPLNQAKNAGETNDLKALPVRTNIIKGYKAKEQEKQHAQENKQPNDEHAATGKGEEVTTPDEKPETAPDPETQKRKMANEMKDVGNRHVKFQQYDLAIKEYTSAINLCPNEAVFYTNRAFCYLKLERYEECIEDCDRAIELDPLAVKAYYRRMQANESLGNYMDALKDCTSALMIEPRNLECKKSLERINERLRKNQNTKIGPNFSPDNENFIEILPIDKPAYKRSSKPLHRVPISDVIGPKSKENFQNLEISDDDIDKLFNSNCGPFVEVKKNTPTSSDEDKPVIVPSKKTETEAIKTTTVRTTDLDLNEAAASVDPLKNEKDSSKTTTLDSNTSPKEQKIEQEPACRPKETASVFTTLKRQLPPPPTSTGQFYAIWKELPDAQKYKYLSSINLGLLCKVLGAGFDSDTLTDCLRILHDYYLPNNDATAAATLLEISRNEEVGLLSLLMSTEDKNSITEILDILEIKRLINPETMKTIKTNFNLI